MDHHQIRDRLHQAIHRAPKATEEDVAGVAAVVLEIVAELNGELALVIAELSDRISALEEQVA
jgi:hypothetical protein